MNNLTEPTLKNLQGDFGIPPKEQNIILKQLGLPHIASFDYITDQGLALAIADLDPVEFDLPNNNDRIKLQIIDASLSHSLVPHGIAGVKKPMVLPLECRQRHGTYKGRFVGRIAWSLNGVEQKHFDKDFGEIPIMIKSNRCHLARMSPAELVSHGEHEQEWGGYFLIKGLERLVRMLLMTRRNFPIAISRSGWKGRGPLFSDMGVIIRCVRQDESSVNNVLHYVTDGTVKVMFSHRKILYYAHLVLILKALCDVTDKYIHKRLLQGYEDKLHYTACVENMIRIVHEQDLHTHEECKAHLGKIFRVKFYECPSWWTDIEIADHIIKRCLMIHLDDNMEKFDMLILMCQKLFVFSSNKCLVEGVDSVMMQELLLGGHLYLSVLKEKLQTFLTVLKSVILKKAGNTLNSLNLEEMKNCARMSGTFESSMEAFLATGNISSQSGLGLMQDKGLTIVPENINRMRYMSHFKAVHRGSFFQEMRTTEVRQLLPDAWGFICPVHTPDGAPCGLLNHLTLDSVVTVQPDASKLAKLPEMLQYLGMKTIDKCKKKSYVVILDGKVMGYVDQERASEMADTLRMLKIKGDEVPEHMEIVLVKAKESRGQFPGLFLFTGPARMMRPLWNLRAGKREFVGTFEQVYMEVSVCPEEAYECTTHMEISKTGFMSNLARLIPMPDCNQSPRNMYQCQMGKQTMGTPCHTWDLQAETKLYRLQTPTSPLFRPVHHDNIGLDDFAMGTNAIVAVISYTGYDMEDAMIINKSSYERGFAHGSIYKTEFIELETTGSYFCRDPTNASLVTYLDTDGLPYVGRKVTMDEPICCFYSNDRNMYVVQKAKAKEECYINSVRLCGEFSLKKPQVACLTFRVPRNPTVGDKFASRAGQKGICSQKWQSVDLPFTETGLVPDIVFNPHGFPSRMTIAMMIEIMAGKSGALHGLVHDATPFKFDEDDTAIDYFGRLLEFAGYDYYGTETMYSGIDGREMNARIFMGVVHYQRLRHMVSDKYQVRATGPIDILTRQPLKGRKRGGGVRFGEMERDSLISHGAPFLLQDRLLHCTDKSTTQLCRKCCTLIGVLKVVTSKAEKPNQSEVKDKCQFCGGEGDTIAEMQIAYIYKFLANQLGSSNISIKLEGEND